MNNSYKVAVATVNQTPIDWQNNINNIKSVLRNAQAEGVTLLCLPELCITGYGCEDLFLSNWIYDKALEELFKLLPFTKNLAVAIGVPVQFEGKNYNTACMIQDGEILGFTAKQFMANDGVHYETRWFTPWPADKIKQININNTFYPIGDIIYDINGQRVAFEICEDSWRGSERPGFKHKEKGVDIILNPSASHFAFGKTKLRQELVLNGSEWFNCTYLFANLLGNEAGKMIYDGELLIAQNGILLERNELLSFHDSQLIVTSLDAKPSKNRAKNISKEMECMNAEALALFDYMRKTWSKGYVLSLSGGADSSLCAIFVHYMIDKGIKELGIEKFLKKLHLENLLGSVETAEEVCVHILSTAYQGTKNSSKNTFNSAKELANSLGASFYYWLIDDEVGSYTAKIEENLGRGLEWSTDDIALQNIQARTRSPIIWMLTNIKNGLLLATSNRSEADVGYATMDGDTSGGISPIAGIDKQFVIDLLKWAEKELGYKALKHVNSLAPTAELRPLESNQTDEDDLMPYPVLRDIENIAIKQYKSPLEVLNELKGKFPFTDDVLRGYVKKFYSLWSRNQWKRERYAPSFHLDEFNVDPRSWCRFPILSGGYREELEKL